MRNLPARLAKRLAALLALFVLGACATSAPEQESHRGLQKGGWQNRYFQHNGRFDYLVGFDLQQLHADVGIDFREKLDFLHEHDINKIRIWLYPSWFGLPGDKNYPADGRILYPWRVDRERNKFDLDQWDPEFWTRTRALLTYARSKDIIVEISLFSIQEPRNYFRQENISYAFKHTDNLQDFGRPTDSNGAFLRGFFALGYSDNGRSLLEYQRALVDKAVAEFEEFDNVYYELINESPGTRYWIENELPHIWTKYWLRYLELRTGQLLTTHSTGFMSLENDNDEGWTREDFATVGSKYWDEAFVDGFNFHLYADDPNLISDALNAFQSRRMTLICNEGGSFYELDRSRGYPDFRVQLNTDEFYGEIRQAWGMMTAGGYYGIYFGPVPLLGDEASRHAARAMQAMRHIVETTPFEQLRPIRDDGTELDDLVSTGPSAGWQVIANEGRSYIVYFWGRKSGDDVEISMPPGRYRYAWFDPRDALPPLSAGHIEANQAEQTLVPAPRVERWTAGAGAVLVINAE